MKKKTSAAASQRFKQTNRFSSSLGEQALTALETSHQLQSAFKLDKDQGRFALPTFSLAGSKIADTCPQPPARCVKDAKVRFDQLGLAPSIQIKMQCNILPTVSCNIELYLRGRHLDIAINIIITNHFISCDVIDISGSVQVH